MNKNIKLAVAGAVLALTASAANAGIIIPAGEWTVDLSGNVNMYTSWAKTTNGSNATIDGGLVSAKSSTSGATVNTMGNGLLPNFLSIGGTTRQNDLDVGFVISLQPGSTNNSALTGVGSAGNGGLNNRQSFITFGDKSWGSVKVGKDLGIFASDAILNDITLLGVGGGALNGGAGSAGNTSLGRIGTGYLYADWKPQIAYTTPNMNGFQATVGITKAFSATSSSQVANSFITEQNSAAVAYEGKASYGFDANGTKGKVWVSGIAQHVQTTGLNDDPMAYAGDIGAQVGVAGFDVSGYYYSTKGVGTTGQFLNGYATVGSKLVARDSDGGYVQVKYTLPTKTIAAISWGQSNLDRATGETASTLVKSNELWNAMAIQPLTKSLNLVAEYSNQRAENHNGQRNTANIGSLGAILFF
jgi:predicted porin